MSEHDADDPAAALVNEDQADHKIDNHEDIEKIKSAFQHRLIAASLRVEAIQAGMIDLDGLKLLDVSSLTLDENDNVANGRQLMQSLRQSKPWLFRAASSSSASAAPSTRPARQKTAMEMTDEEYRAARNALTKY